MHRPDALALLPVLTCVSLLAGAAEPGAAQERDVVANTVVVSGDEASLELEFSDGGHLSLSFSGGVARFGDEVLGRYEADGEADQAWRELLAEVLPLTNGPLAQRLREWEPGEAHSAADRQILAEVNRVLERALRPTAAPSALASSGAPQDGGWQEADWAREFMQGLEAEGFWEAVRDMDPRSFKIVADEDYEVPADAVEDHHLLVVDGQLDVRGYMHGDVVLVDAAMVVHEGGRVLGDVRHVGSRVERMGGVVAGDVVDLIRERRQNAERERDRVRAELRREFRELEDRRVHRRQPSAFARVGGALGDLVATAALFVMLALLAVGATTVAGERGEVVTRAVGRDPAKSLVVGLAGAFLALPLYLLGIAALAVTIIGIPGLVVWIPLYPVALLAAAFVGLVAASRHVGAWVLAREYGFLQWAHPDNRNHVAVVGLGAMILPMAVGKAMPLIGWTGNILEMLSSVAIFGGAVAGLGAVITTRGGRRLADDYAFHDDLDAAAWAPDIRYETAEADDAAAKTDEPEPPEEALEEADDESSEGPAADK